MSLNDRNWVVQPLWPNSVVHAKAKLRPLSKAELLEQRDCHILSPVTLPLPPQNISGAILDICYRILRSVGTGMVPKQVFTT